MSPSSSLVSRSLVLTLSPCPLSLYFSQKFTSVLSGDKVDFCETVIGFQSE